MLQEIQKENQQVMEEKEKSYQEHVRQLTEKMEKERAQLIAEQERTLALKLKVFNCITLRFLLFCFLSTLPDLLVCLLEHEAQKDLSRPLILSVCLT